MTFTPERGRGLPDSDPLWGPGDDWVPDPWDDPDLVPIVERAGRQSRALRWLVWAMIAAIVVLPAWLTAGVQVTT